MNINLISSPDPEILAEIGRRLRALRRAQKLTMAQVAERATLDRMTVSRAEHGDNPTLLTLVKMLRVYGRLAALEEFLMPPEISPLEVLRLAERRGGRASRRS